MGILRTDKISGLETPTAVTGAVEFDGTGDYLSFATSTDFALGTDDWTVEWFAYPTSETQYQRHFYLQGSSSSNIDGVFADSSGIAFGRTGVWAATAVLHPLNQWNHYALVHDSTNMRLYINGVESTTSTSNFGTDSTKTLNIGYSNSTFGGYFTGNISNFRILRGTALYTSDFAVPIHELEVIGDTVLLCCNNPDSAGAEATGKTITVNGDAAASTVSPGLTRDFTGGTEFKGVTTFDTQGYFVPPSGMTTDRDRTGGRGLFFGGYAPSPASLRNIIDYVTISSQGNAQDFGDLLSTNNGEGGNCASSTRALAGGGQSNSVDITFVTISTTSNATDFGDLITGRRSLAGASSSTRGVFAGGTTPTMKNEIEYVTIAALGNALDFGDLTVARRNLAPAGSPTRGVFAGGNPGSSPNLDLTIDYITFATTGNAIDFGNLVQANRDLGGTSSSTRAIFGGGTPGSGVLNIIDFITIATTGDAQDFGDLSVTRSGTAGVSNKIRGLFGGGSSPTYQNIIEFVTIASTGDAADFGDLTAPRFFYGATSDSHGGIS